MKEYKNIELRSNGHISIITLKNSPVNAITFELCDELAEAFDDFKKNRDIWCVIIESAFDKVFCAGADVKNLSNNDRQRNIYTSDYFRKAFESIENFNHPVICAVNGIAFGGGLELALACDLRVFDIAARAALPEAGLGICPGAGGTQRLTRLIGAGAARRIIYTGEIIPADEAYRLGLCEYITNEPMTAKKKAMEVAELICSKAPEAVMYDKQAISYAADNHSLSDGLRFEALLTSDMFSTEDQKEGLNAFLEKRVPVFKNK